MGIKLNLKKSEDEIIFEKKKNSEKDKKKDKLEKLIKKDKETKDKKQDKKNKDENYSWKAFFPFTKEAKELKKTRKKTKEKKSKKIFSFEPHLIKAGYEFTDEKKVKKRIFKISIFITLLMSFFAIVNAIKLRGDYKRLIAFMFGYWTFVFILTLMIIALFFVLFLDLRAYKRTKEVEDVLPDFLQLAAANITAGMPVDKALWFAVRPSFGILAKEIEHVAKATYAGKPLAEALTEFGQKFDSKTLQRSISLLLEGMSAGGEMAGLLNKISLDIEETNLLKKEMAASVTTYVIFIGFATIFGAPFMLGLSTTLLSVIKTVAGEVAGTLGSSSSAGGMFSFNMNPNAVTAKDFKIYAVTMLMVSSFFSGSIISVIRKGNIKEGVVLIPTFIVVTLALYFIFTLALGALMNVFI